MSLNKFMHPRNRYKYKKPDFQALAQKFPEFSLHVITNEKGKLELDFKNPDAVRVLTTCLLHEDYGLKIEIPPDRLVPTLPLRLNYVHWIEDITSNWNKKELYGIDIGTGGCCIYPILAISGNPWRFLATEADELNYDYALKNLEINKLTDRIKVVRVSDSTILEGVISNTSEMFDFCMCNPPFFADHFEAQGLVSRTPNRPDPKTMSTASPQEGIVQGGEIAFVRKMIEESCFLQDRVRVYSTMLGKKASLAPLKEILRRNKINNLSGTEFCQGKTMRWGLAWTFDKSVIFPKSEFSQGKKEGKKSVIHIIPTKMGERREPINNLVCFFRQLFSELKIHVHEGKQTKYFALLTVTAAENTWIHSRRKRRQQKRESCSPQKATPKTPDAKAAEGGGENLVDQRATPITEASIQKTTQWTEKMSAHEPILEDDSLVRVEKAERVESDVVDMGVSSEALAQQHLEIPLDGAEAKTGLKRKLEEDEQVGDTAADIPGEAVQAKRSKTAVSTADSAIDEAQSVPRTKDLLTNANTTLLVPAACQEIEEALNGVGEVALAVDNCASVVTAQDAKCAGPDAEITESKDRPPAEYILKCHMAVRVQDSDLAVELTWLSGKDIQMMHQLMQFMKNQLALRQSL